MYIDDVPSEALKAGSDDIKRPIRHLFNIVYNKSIFPDLWCDGIIEKYDRLDVNNYRGIFYLKLFRQVIPRHHQQTNRKFMSNLTNGA